MYATGDSWKSWMKDFKFGTLVFVPGEEFRDVIDNLRKKYDPVSAFTSMAHITLTQPSKPPSPEDIATIHNLVSRSPHFEVNIGPAKTSPNKRLLWLDVAPRESVLTLRESLHETGLFRTDLPLTKGFIPHMTVSEAAREPDEVSAINHNINSQLKPRREIFRSVSWIIPNEKFIFAEYRSFNLR